MERSHAAQGALPERPLPGMTRHYDEISRQCPMPRVARHDKVRVVLALLRLQQGCARFFEQHVDLAQTHGRA